MGRDGRVPGSARLYLAGGAVLLRPEEQVPEAMVEGWRAQQLARNPPTGGRTSARPSSAHPVQVCHEWNTAVHVQEAEGDPAKRAFTVAELQAFFDHADARSAGSAAAAVRGWLPVFRDTTAFKAATGSGCGAPRPRCWMVADFGPDPRAAEFGEYGLCQVRFGKASRGSSPKRRSVLTVWPWLPGVLEQWIGEARPLMPATADSPALWPSERGIRIGAGTLNRLFTECRDALGLATGLDFHSLRRSYVTHPLEDGWDALFIQHQVGHEYASTTALHSCASSDFRTRTLRRALAATMTAALQPGKDKR